MKRLFLALTLVVTLVAQLSLIAIAADQPLTLLEKPNSSSQSSASPPQMSQIPQPGQMGQMGQMGQSAQGAQTPQSASEQMTMYDVYGVVPTRAPVPYLYIGLGILLALLVSALIYWLYKRKKRPRAVPVILPWERALTDLTEARSLFGMGQGRAYMDRVSQILRCYVEDRFAIKSTRQTTREFLRSLKNTNDSEISNYKMELQNCLEQADMAKFAHKVQDEQNLNIMETAVATFVHATSPSGQVMEDGK
ncbi:hypothetical protein [Desulforhopalus sp. 52FAK]